MGRQGEEAHQHPPLLQETADNGPTLTALAKARSTTEGKSAGLVAHFSPYAVGPYAEGSYTVFVPWTAFQDYLSGEGRAIFGGERPKDDEKRDEND